MKEPTKGETRLLRALGKIQDLAGRAKSNCYNDRDPDRLGKVVTSLEELFEICVAERSRFGEVKD